MTERIQKVLSRAGFGSRRNIEKLIEAGRVQINGRIAKLGDKISQYDTVYLDGKLSLIKSDKLRILLYHKPLGEVSTRKDPEGRATVFETLPPLFYGRWINVGRLDINTSGLLLFTNNGDFANRFIHPSSRIEREYAVRIMGKVSSAVTKRLLYGVQLEDGKARFEDIVSLRSGNGRNRWFRVVVIEGRNRLVRRLWESQGVKVSRLIRVRLGPFILPRCLRQGEWEEIEASEVTALQNILKIFS